MSYDIPDEIKYKEKIVANLDLKQLGYLVLFSIIAIISYNMQIEGDARYILPLSSIIIGVAFIFLNLEEKLLDIISYYTNIRKAQYNSKKSQKFFEIKSIDNDALYLEDGTFLAILEVDPINFTLLDNARKKALLVNYRAFLNQLTDPVQILIKTRKVHLKDYFKRLSLNVTGRSKLLLDLYADFKIYEDDFLRKNEIMERHYYLVIPFFKNTTLKQINDAVEIIQDKLAGCDLNSKRLDNAELETFLNSYADNSDNPAKKMKVEKNETSEDSFRNDITPTFDIHQNYADINGELHNIVKITGYPRKVEDGWLQTFLSRNENYDISIHLMPSSINYMLVYLHNQIIQQTGDLILSTAKGTPNPSLEIKKADTMRIYDSLYKGEEKLFQMSLYLDVKANEPEELNFLTEKCKSNLNAQLMIPKKISWRIADGIKSTMPLAKDKLFATREMLASALAATFPFISVTSPDQKGILFAHEVHTKNPIFLDLENQSNKHFFIIGISGSGKSYAAKYFAVQQLFKEETRLYVLDPNGEYSSLCNSLDGQVVEISKESNYILNLFDINNDDFGGKMLQLVSAFDIIMGGLNEGQKAIISDAVSRAYKKKGIRANREETWNRKPPKFTDLKKVLEEMMGEFSLSSPHGRSLDAIYRRVKMYCEDGVFGFLDKDTRMKTGNSVVCFDLSQLPQAIKPLMIFMVLGFIQRQISNDKHSKTVLIDEGWVLLRSKEAEEYLLEFVKTSRKFNASIGFITQEVEDLLQSNTGRSILNTASIKILMRQSPSSINLVSSNLRLNEFEENFLMTARKGQGLVITEDNSYCFYIDASPKIHGLITTDPNEQAIVVKEEGGQKVVVDLNKPLYVRNELSEKEVGELVANGYDVYVTRLTTSDPYIEYVVKVRHNESVEHAFLCWFTASLLSKKKLKIKTPTTRGPDIEFKLKKKKYCFEIETGKRLRYMKRSDMEARFAEKTREYDYVYLIVPNERIGRTYHNICDNIITKAEIMAFIDSF